MAFGLQYTNNSDVVTVDSEFTRLVVLAKGSYRPTQESNLGSVTSFPRTITSQEPPLIFCRPIGSSGIGAVCYARVIGSPGAWTGFYIRTYSTGTLQPYGTYFAAGFGAQNVADWGMRLWDANGKLLFDSDTPYVRFTRAFQNWAYVKSDTSEQGYTRNYYRVSFNFPAGEHMLVNTFGMDMCDDYGSSRQLANWWDFSGGNLYAITVGNGNPFAFYMPAVFAKL